MCVTGGDLGVRLFEHGWQDELPLDLLQFCSGRPYVTQVDRCPGGVTPCVRAWVCVRAVYNHNESHFW